MSKYAFDILLMSRFYMHVLCKKFGYICTGHSKKTAVFVPFYVYDWKKYCAKSEKCEANEIKIKLETSESASSALHYYFNVSIGEI